MAGHVEVICGGDGEPSRWELHVWPTLVVRGGLSGLGRCTRSWRNCGHEELDGGATSTTNFGWGREDRR